MIETRDLRKIFPGRGRRAAPVEAVRGISFRVGRGEIFGLLGPNGAGKTTTMRMLCTLLSPSAGLVRIAGRDLGRGQGAIRRRIGYVSQVGGMQREATGRENLLLQAKLYGLAGDGARRRVGEVLDLLDLNDFADRKTSTYSGGQRRIFDLAAGIVHEPQILFLDEPSTGLDPQNRAHVWEQVKKLNARGTTIFLTTHYLEEADALCARVAIVDHGEIVALGAPDELKRQIAGDVLSLRFADPAAAALAKEFLAGQPFVRGVELKGAEALFYVDRGDENLPIIMRLLHEQNFAIAAIRLSRPTLDDVFLKLTGRTLTE